MSAAEARAHVAVASRYDNIELVSAVVGELCQQAGMVEDGRHWVDLAVREAMANAIRHGNEEDPAKRVRVRVTRANGDLVVAVRDQGSGFDVDGVEDPTRPENLLKPCGRGIFYMRSLMDRVEFRFEPRGTEVTLRKRIEVEEERES